MGARGPQPVTSLMGPIIPGAPVPPPEGLSEEERETWTAIAATLPADWFRGAAHVLLTQFVRHVRHADLIAAEINRLRPQLAEDPKRWTTFRGLMKALGFQSDKIAMLSTKLRLCPSSKYRAEHKDAGGGTTGIKPWEDWGSRARDRNRS
jgi:hypothetical protein